MAELPYSALSHLDCSRCGTRYDADRVQGTCSCGSPLLARYDLRQVAGQVSVREIAGRPPDLWRYHELLPVRQAGHVVSLGEGMTPLLPMPKAGQALGVPGLLMKDEGVIDAHLRAPLIEGHAEFAAEQPADSAGAGSGGPP